MPLSGKEHKAAEVVAADVADEVVGEQIGVAAEHEVASNSVEVLLVALSRFDGGSQPAVEVAYVHLLALAARRGFIPDHQASSGCWCSGSRVGYLASSTA